MYLSIVKKELSSYSRGKVRPCACVFRTDTIVLSSSVPATPPPDSEAVTELITTRPSSLANSLLRRFLAGLAAFVVARGEPWRPAQPHTGRAWIKPDGLGLSLSGSHPFGDESGGGGLSVLRT
jgi:hypothetical protein